MEQINNRISIGDGWTKDKETGQIFDPDGYKWYGQMIGGSQEIITKPEDMATIHDTGSGGQRVLKFFRCGMPPGKELPPKDEIYRAMIPVIQDHLAKCGLTTDENHETIVHQDEPNREYLIVVPCKPSGKKAMIYEGMKEGEGGVFIVGDLKTTAHKTDNISTLLNKKK